MATTIAAITAPARANGAASVTTACGGLGTPAAPTGPAAHLGSPASGTHSHSLGRMSQRGFLALTSAGGPLGLGESESSPTS